MFLCGRRAVMRILLTGFEPFGADTSNASEQTLKLLPRSLGEHQILTGILPVSFGRSARVLDELISGNAPEAVVLLGEAGGRTQINLERFAVNQMSARIADNDGAQPAGERIEPDGPIRREATMAVPSELMVSEDAGRFVCNRIAYHAYGLPIPAQFIHVPAVRPHRQRALIGAETDAGAPVSSELSVVQLAASLTKYLQDICFHHGPRR
ncbi:pyroglutamyl-peptidase I family protein [Glutamicibacter ardleyensis]|uniref:pyroglutamyl-peptidase I family protein n=1 Tax=Glutamicibacter ardleyensis TaxID=225894 RepID=UPI003FD5FF17